MNKKGEVVPMRRFNKQKIEKSWVSDEDIIRRDPAKGIKSYNHI